MENVLPNVPWLRPDPYWIALITSAPLPASAASALASVKAERREANGRLFYVIFSATKWDAHWQQLVQALEPHGGVAGLDAAVISSTPEPLPDDFLTVKKPAERMEAIAKSLWLGSALQEDRVICHLQPIVDLKRKVYGYESYVRVKNTDGSIVNGGAVVGASRALGIEYVIDRQLHIKAVQTFVQAGLSGSLFINFMPGFIQRAEVYLEGLSEAVKEHGLARKQVVLDVPKGAEAKDLQQLQRLSDYCKSAGFALAIDDVEHFSALQELLRKVTPEFVKLDMQLIKKAKEPVVAEEIRMITQLAQSAGCMVVGEGVENEETLQLLGAAGVDLFQGYHISPPTDAAALKQKFG